MAFLTIAGIAVPVLRTAATESPDGYGKRRWRFTTGPVAQSVHTALAAAIGAPGGSESDRARDGTLHTSKPLVALAGEGMVGGATTGEVTITEAAYRHYRDPDTQLPTFRRVLTLDIREA